MRRKDISYVIIFIITFIVQIYPLWALEKDTHKFLNEKIVRNYSPLNAYLINQLGYAKGIENTFNSKTIEQWIGIGGSAEDEPMYSRSFNHFHNPLKTWDNAGFDGTFQSSVIWAQDQGAFGSLWGGNFSWKAVREYYYIALTGKDVADTPVAPTQTDREKYFGKTFRGLGQDMHLLQDASVPAHTRNDTHVIGYHYELAVDKMRINGDAVFTNAVGNPITFDPVILTSAPNPLAPIPIAKLFDTDKYDSSSPDPAVTAGSAIGLAEYSNANFVSEGLVGANFQNFPFPKISEASIIGKPYSGPSGTYIREYYTKSCCGETNAGQGYLLSTVDLLDYWRQRYPLLSVGLPIIPGMDDNVYKDYASLLLPRAVGYSAGLLNYFFRGKLGITQVSSGIKVKNLGTETMSSYIDQATLISIGTITVFYDDTSGNRTFLANYDLTTPLEPGAVTDVISFATPTNNITPKRYIVVFRGKLGNEEGAVIGKVALPPHVYYVATSSGWDKIYKIEADGTNQGTVYDNPDGDYIGRIAPSPDGNTIAFASSPDGLVVNSNIYLLSLIDTNPIPTILTSGNWPSWSPDGTKISFERDISLDPYSADIEIFTIDVATGVEAQLTNIAGSSYSGSPAWSPDGNSIAYSQFVQSQAGCATNYVISLMDTAGNPIGPLTCPPEGEYMSVGDFDPAWSPDGQEIAFTRRKYVGRSSQLNKVDIATKAITRLTDCPDVGYDEFTPAWSLDEMSIAISSMRDGDYDLWLVDPNGAGYLQNITNTNPDIEGYPAFGK